MKTLPRPLKPEDYEFDTKDLAAGRYGTYEMIQVWGPEKTFEYALLVQGQASVTLSKLHPDIVSPEHALEISSKANLQHISPDRIRQIERETGHDGIGFNTALEEVLSHDAKPHINKIKTTADTTQPARALQLKASIEIIAGSVENLRDILVEKSQEWSEYLHMDNTHLFDALPTVAGRPFSHYAEMLQSGLDLLKFVYTHSIKGKWADATGNHHGAVTLGIDGIALQETYCNDLGIGFMTAPAQVPGLEFEADIVFCLARFGETINNIAKYSVWGKSADVDIFFNTGKKKKGSSAMPHKDRRGGNPVDEEQVMSVRNYMMGWMSTSLANSEMPYARSLAASANSRINFEDGFKFLDQGIRKMAGVVYNLGLNIDRAAERVHRSYGVVTSAQVMTYLTDYRVCTNPMPRSVAHNLVGDLATKAWDKKRPFYDVLMENPEVTSRISSEVLHKITNPSDYIGESKRIIHTVAEKWYQKKTLK